MFRVGARTGQESLSFGPSCLLQFKLSLSGLTGSFFCRKSGSHGCKFCLDLDPHHILVNVILL